MHLISVRSERTHVWAQDAPGRWVIHLPISQMEKLWLREEEGLAQGHTTGGVGVATETNLPCCGLEVPGAEQAPGPSLAVEV